MKLYRVLKAVAVVAAVCSLAVMFAATDAHAQQAGDPPGQAKKNDPNNGNNQGQPPGQVGNTNSNRGGHCNGNARNCGGPVITTTEVGGEVEDSEGAVINCLLPEFKRDPRCVTPSTKKTKRKVVSVKLDQQELAVTPPAAAPAPAPAVAAPEPAVKAKATSSSALPEANDISTSNFQ